jgi:hypothetical protein
VALTLPEETVRGLRKIHPDLGWAIVRLLEKASTRRPVAETPQPDVELVTIADRRSLIVVNRAVFKHLPGINIIPLHGNQAFLTLEVGRGMTDLELAVIDRLDDPALDLLERKALLNLRAQLRAWRRDPSLRFHARSIIVVEGLPGRSRRTSVRRAIPRPAVALRQASLGQADERVGARRSDASGQPRT